MDRKKLEKELGAYIYKQYRLSLKYDHHICLWTAYRLAPRVESLIAEETQELQEVLMAAYRAVEVAIYSEDGMEGADGEGIMKMIERVSPEARKAKAALDLEEK